MSSSSPSSSTPSASTDVTASHGQMKLALQTSPGLPITSFTYEDMFISPAARSVQAPPSSFDDPHTHNHLDHMDMPGHVRAAMYSLDFDDFPDLLFSDFMHFSQDYLHSYVSDLPFHSSPTNASASSLLLPVQENILCLEPPAGPDIQFDLPMVHPMEQASSPSNDVQLDAMHSSYEIAREVYEGHHVASPNETSSLSCRSPPLTCQAASLTGSESIKDYEQQLCGHGMLSPFNAGGDLTDVCAELDQHGHATLSAMISDSLLADCLVDGRSFQADIDHKHMREQGLVGNKERNDGDKKLFTPLLSQSTERHETYLLRERSDNQEEDMVVSSARFPSRTGDLGSFAFGSDDTVKAVASCRCEALGRHVNEVCGSAEADNVARRSSTGKGAGKDEDDIVSTSSYMAGEFTGAAMAGYDQEGAGFSGTRGSYVSCASDSAEAERIATPAAWSGVFPARNSKAGEDHQKLNHSVDIAVKQQEDALMNLPSPPYENTMNPAQVHHMRAERKRRRQEADCIKTLRSLLPHISKKDKLTILDSTICHLKKLKARIGELEQEKSGLMIPSSEDRTMPLEDSDQSTTLSPHDNILEFSKSNRHCQQTAACYYKEDVKPHFRLNLIKNCRDSDMNAKVLEIINVLGKKNFHCSQIQSKFWKDDNQISLRILATYKDGVECSPKEVEHINKWWQQINKDNVNIKGNLVDCNMLNCNKSITH